MPATAIDMSSICVPTKTSYNPGTVWAGKLMRNVDDPAVVKFYLSNAPETIETACLARMCGMRWPIELTFEVGKDELGMDQYETRSWLGWQHHMVLVMLAHHFLVWVRQQFQEKAPALTLPVGVG